MAIVVDTCSLVMIAKNYLPLDKDGQLYSFLEEAFSRKDLMLLDVILDESKRTSKGIAVEIYSTTLHFAPCHASEEGFIMLVALPKGTNVGSITSDFDPMLYQTNKWLIARPDSFEAKNKNAHVGLIGDLIRLD